jgi:hypothetical protein
MQVKRYANPFLLAEEKEKKREERGLRFGLIDPEEKAKKERRLQKFGPLEPAGAPIGVQETPEAEAPEDEDKGKGLELEEDEGEVEEEEGMDVGTLQLTPCTNALLVVESRRANRRTPHRTAPHTTETREPKKEWPVEIKRRQDTLYLYGTDKMSTEDVFKYFVEHKPRFVEWIDDSSCNVVFDNQECVFCLLVRRDVVILSDASGCPHRLAAQAFIGVSNPADNEAVLAVPPGEPEVLYIWRRGKQPWRNHTLLMRFATIEDRRPVVPKKSAYVEEMLRKRAQQRTVLRCCRVCACVVFVLTTALCRPSLDPGEHHQGETAAQDTKQEEQEKGWPARRGSLERTAQEGRHLHHGTRRR